MCNVLGLFLPVFHVEFQKNVGMFVQKQKKVYVKRLCLMCVYLEV